MYLRTMTPYMCMSINTRRNIAKDANSTFLKTCRFDESNEETLYCPIFSLKQIVDMIKPTKAVPWKQDFRNISVKV